MHDLVACDLCERTILKGERIEVFVASGDRRRVCELCTLQALRLRWPRESELAEQSPERQRERERPRRAFWTRIVQWAEEQGLLGGAPGAPDETTAERPHPPREATVPTTAAASTAAASASATAAGPGDPLAGANPESEHVAAAPVASTRSDEQPAPHESSRAKRFEEEASRELERADHDFAGDGWAAWARRPSRPTTGPGFKELLTGRRREPREVHAVPTSPDGKLERAFELFNASEHRRTVAGIGRTLGEPWVNASLEDDDPAASEITIVVAWELSWYRYRIDLGDADQAVHLLDRGDEINDLDEALREWNAAADDDGCLALAAQSVS